MNKANVTLTILLKKYHQGIATENEQKMLFELIRSKSIDDDLKGSMKEIWDETQTTSPLGFDKEAIFQNVTKKIEFEKAGGLGSKLVRFRILAIAASLAITLLSAWVVYVQFYKADDQQMSHVVDQFKEFETVKGQFRTVSLPDGSVVKLNSSSKLRIGQTYSSDAQRVVYLEGEAYFDVHRNVHKPFIVVTKDIEVEVLGTSFNVNSNFNSQSAKVAVASGKVKVQSVDKSNQVFLEKDQMVTISENQFLKLTGIDRLKEFGWVDKNLIFDQADFDQVVLQLENWYGVEVKVLGMAEADGQWNYTAVFENQSLENVLLSMGFVKHFKYEINDKEVKLKF